MISSLASGSRVIALDEEFVRGADFPASRAWRHQFPLKHVVTTLRISTVIIRTSKKSPARQTVGPPAAPDRHDGDQERKIRRLNLK